jgi:hypothetical protein
LINNRAEAQRFAIQRMLYAAFSMHSTNSVDDANQHAGGTVNRQFLKYLDHESAFGPPVQPGLARGCAMSGDSAKARIAYQDFLTKWKDADSDIPIQKQASAEYAKLQ